MASLSSVDFYKANGYEVIRKSGFHSEFSTWIECVNLEKRLDEMTELENCFQWFKDNFLCFFNLWFEGTGNKEQETIKRTKNFIIQK